MPSSTGLRRIGFLLVILGVGGGATAYWLLQPGAVDMVTLLEMNNRGIGHMERFEYDKAAEAFQKVVDKAPRWQPGRINLGIALLNNDPPKHFRKAIALFEGVLREDPSNNHAEFCLGIIREHQGVDLDQAARHFEAVTRRDPDDPHAWFFLAGIFNQSDDKDRLERARECYEKVAVLDPYIAGALNNLQLLYRRLGKDDEADKILERFQRLKRGEWESHADKKYAEMGKYAEVIGRNPREPAAPPGPLPIFIPDAKFQVQLAKHTRWATAKDFGNGPEGDLCRAVRKRFGGTIAVFDYNRDGRLDLFLAGAVVRVGTVTDLLLKNEGDGKFRDVTEDAGLAGFGSDFRTLGATVADFDNDGLPDLILTGMRDQKMFLAKERVGGRAGGEDGRDAGVVLLRNPGGKEPRFQALTKAAGLHQMTGVCMGAALADLDQDSDLDLLVTRLGGDVASALATIENAGKGGKDGGVAVFLNTGEAPPNSTPDKPLPLTPKFKRADDLFGALSHPAVNLAVSDLDGDRDIDVLVLGAGGPPAAIMNDRLLKFQRKALPESVISTGPWNGIAVLDLDRDEKSDLLAVGPGQKPALLVQGKRGADTWFGAGVTNAPPLLQAQAIDLDLDGWIDVVGLSEERLPVLLHNDAGKLVDIKQGLGAKGEWAKDLVAVVAADFDGRCLVDFMVWSEADGLRLFRNQGNGNHGLPVVLTGIRDKGTHLRCNSDAIGARIGAQVRNIWTTVEIATMQTGLGQSRHPLLLGLGTADHADFISIRWPDGIWQAEMNLPGCQRLIVRQTNRKSISCPLLFTWNGKQFEYITDFIGAGSLGEPLPGGGHRPPRPEESVKIEAHQLLPKDGRYVLKFAEPMDEVTYLDRLRLVVVDHPADVRAYPDERFQSESRPATQDLLVFSSPKQVFAEQAKDHRGMNLTKTLEQWDRQSADGFAKRSWIGFAEEHWVEMDFGSRLAQFGPKDRLTMFLAGWTDYPYPESIWAASQAGHSLLAPVLERLGDDGKWQVVRDDLSFPAGLPRMMTYDVTGLVAGSSCKLRIRTNMHVYWDQIFIAPLVERVPYGQEKSTTTHLTALDVHGAVLENRGCVQEYSPDGKEPTVYAYDKLDKVAVTRQSGRLTTFGDVKELLTERDDRFVIFGPGDELTVTFPADRLPPLKEGWQRSFVLQTWGYCKDCSPFTATGDTIGPLPFHGMKSFPYGPNEYPGGLLEYQRLWNTRQIGSSPR